MTFIDAVKALKDGHKVHSDNLVTNGEREELVLVMETPFIKSPRTRGTGKDNYIFASPNAEEIFDDSWEIFQED